MYPIEKNVANLADQLMGLAVKSLTMLILVRQLADQLELTWRSSRNEGRRAFQGVLGTLNALKLLRVLTVLGILREGKRREYGGRGERHNKYKKNWNTNPHQSSLMNGIRTQMDPMLTVLNVLMVLRISRGIWMFRQTNGLKLSTVLQSLNDLGKPLIPDPSPLSTGAKGARMWGKKEMDAMRKRDAPLEPLANFPGFSRVFPGAHAAPLEPLGNCTGFLMVLR